MKRVHLLSILAVLSLLLCCILPTKAEATTEGYYTYTVSNGEATITDCSLSTNGDITIPSTLGGYPVTSIGEYAFEGCESLTGITLPEGVSSIGYGAFDSCVGLTSITIPDSVTSIGDGAFWNCCSLEYNTYNDASYLGNSSNPYHVLIDVTSTSITSCAIHQNTKYVYMHAFSGCKYLTSIIIPNSVIIIDDWAFSNCTSLTNIIIPDSVTSIGENAFMWCKSLTNVTIPDSVTNVGDHAFGECSSLIGIWVDKGNEVYASDARGVLLNKGMTSLIQVPKAISGAYAIPSTVISIGEYAFEDCSKLTSVTIGDSVTSIGNSAFSGCSNLVSVRIPDSVTVMGEGAFAFCRSLTSIEIPSSVTSLDFTFYQCDKLASVSLSEGLTRIGDGVFYGCNLTEIRIPDSVTHIFDDVFDSCADLTSVTIGKGVTHIGQNAFGNCASLEYFYVDEANTSFSSDPIGTLYNKDKTKLIQFPSAYKGRFEVPDGVTEIAQAAFVYCSGLSSVSIPSSVANIHFNAFGNLGRSLCSASY